MVVLAALPENDYRGVAEIARSTGSPRNYLGKLLLQLSRRGLVESRKGLGGGFRLSRPAPSIRLYDVMAAIEDVSRWTSDAFTNGVYVDSAPRAVHDRWERAHDAFLAFLKDTTIAELAGSEPELDAGAACACTIRPSIKQS